MDFITAAFVSFVSFYLVMRHLPHGVLLRLMGYVGWVDLALHAGIILLFLGTSTTGLLQAEAAGIMFSLYFRGWRWWHGYERLTRNGWVVTPGYKHLRKAT